MLDMDSETEIIQLPSYDRKPILYAVNANSENKDPEYFPEKYLCCFLKEHNLVENPIVYT